VFGEMPVGFKCDPNPSNKFLFVELYILIAICSLVHCLIQGAMCCSKNNYSIASPDLWPLDYPTDNHKPMHM